MLDSGALLNLNRSWTLLNFIMEYGPLWKPEKRVPTHIMRQKCRLQHAYFEQKRLQRLAYMQRVQEVEPFSFTPLIFSTPGLGRLSLAYLDQHTKRRVIGDHYQIEDVDIRDAFIIMEVGRRGRGRNKEDVFSVSIFSKTWFVLKAKFQTF